MKICKSSLYFVAPDALKLSLTSRCPNPPIEKKMIMKTDKNFNMQQFLIVNNITQYR